MKALDIIYSAITERNTTSTNVAKKLGKHGAQYITNMKKNKSLTIKTFVSLMEVLGYEVVIKDKISGKEVWSVDVHEEVK